MKKVFVLLAFVAFVAALCSSCKTADCPAYSKVENNEVEQVTS